MESNRRRGKEAFEVFIIILVFLAVCAAITLFATLVSGPDERILPDGSWLANWALATGGLAVAIPILGLMAYGLIGGGGQEG